MIKQGTTEIFLWRRPRRRVWRSGDRAGSDQAAAPSPVLNQFPFGRLTRWIPARNSRARHRRATRNAQLNRIGIPLNRRSVSVGAKSRRVEGVSRTTGSAVAYKGVFIDHVALRRLRIAGLTRAGEPRRWIAAGEALHIMTGAPVPRGADRVAMQERCTVEDGVVTPPCLLPSGTNIRRRGEDVGIGNLLVPALKRLDARHIAILAAAGHGRVSCIRALRIGLIATGDELVLAAAEAVPFRVRDSNTPMLTALLSAAPDIELEIVRCRDSVDEITESIAEMSETCDLVITTGGMSFGVEDHVRSACLRLGGRFALHAVAMKPGKPVGLAILPNCILLGLPGNPFAAFVTFLVVGREVLACLRGRRPDHLSRPAIADFEMARRPGRSEFFPVGVSGYDHTGLTKLRRLGKGGSARLMPLTLADGLGCIAAETPIVSKGDPIEFIDMRQAFDV